MKVFKFGGASVKDAANIRNVVDILKIHKGEQILVVVSATGKTTNALEKVVEAYIKGEDTFALLEEVKNRHFKVMEELLPEGHEAFAAVNDLFVEIEWVIEDKPHDAYDYIYDQIVSVGELVSSRILTAFLNVQNISAQWQDARDVLRTDESYREGKVDWDFTGEAIQEHVRPQLMSGGFVVTQGFIGSTSENNTTTLGREGSDYTAAIFSYCLDASSMSIWKDVPGVLTGDPRLFEHVTKIDRLSYKEAVEMTYYGAQVIHPKTIKPIQNKNIPLYVRSFINPNESGTVVGDFPDEKYPPVVVVATDQVLLNITPKNFSFVAEEHLSRLFNLFAEHRIKVNMMRNTAISFSVCVKFVPEKIKAFLSHIEEDFNVTKNEDLELITVRHFNEEVLKPLRKARIVLFEERIADTIQMVMKNVPVMERKLAT